MPEYGDRNYWDNRYASEDDPFDWLCDWEELEPMMRPLMDNCPLSSNRDPRILVVGCGNAPFSSDIYRKGGYKNLVNIDYSKVVIDQQKERHPDMNWFVMDALNMDFPDNEFDVIVDKSLIDTTMCYKNGQETTFRLFEEIHRVLKPAGRLFLISLHPEKDVIPFRDTPGCRFAATTCSIVNSRCRGDDPKCAFHTFAVFDKLAELGEEEEKLVQGRHPLSIANAVTGEECENLLSSSIEDIWEPHNEKDFDIGTVAVDHLMDSLDSTLKDIEKFHKLCHVFNSSGTSNW